MIGGALYREALRALQRLQLPEAATRDVTLALEAALPGPIPVLWSAGQEAGLSPEALLARGSGLFIAFAAGNLADDLCDGDCTLWPDPERHAPYVQYLLQNLALSELVRGGLGAGALGRMGQELARGAGPQALEVRTREWTPALYREVAEGIAGRQWAAYFTALYDGTGQETTAAQRGLALGIAAHTAEDRSSGDLRFYTLSSEGRADICAWAAAYAERLGDDPAGWVQRLITPLLEQLRAPEDAPTDTTAVRAYYEAKTESILRRYGPGPRVHFHTGLVDRSQPLDVERSTLSARIREGQEALLEHLSGILGQHGHAPGRLLDVGCGLGGGSLFWASRGAQVTAITHAEGHVPRVMDFARQEGLADRIEVRLCDALEDPGGGPFDTVFACESSCYFPRAAWMQHVAGLLRPGGRLLIADGFLGHASQRIPFDRYWRTRIGTRDEYFEAARNAGLLLEVDEDLAERAADFWDVTLALLEHERRDAVGGARERLRASRREHRRHRDGLRDGSLGYGVLLFRRP
ncbi:MAG TPA: methyltransferase domain-containing protein [Myxococcaceae bacterium]|nr:methyltransferase domain-containing protein [Myxococcaceae bacterium]